MDEPIRIAQIMGKMLGGGVEAVVMNYYRHINRAKVQFDFIIDEDSLVVPTKEIEALGGRVIMIPPYQKPIAYQKALYNLFCCNNYQIVHAHLNTMSIFSLYAAWRAKVPIRIVHNHSTAGKGETKRNIMKYTLRPFAKLFPTHYCACSKFAGEWLFGKSDLHNGKVTIWPNAIEIDEFLYNEEERKEMRSKLGIENSFVMGHIGRFISQKNHDFLIDIFKNVKTKVPESKLLLAGDGKLVSEIKHKVTKLGLENDVQFLGLRDDANKLYQAMDIFILPSLYEGLPVVGVEAQSAGLPCVLSDDVTRETKLLDTTSFLNRDAPASIWADAIIEKRSIQRKNVRSEIEAHGFEINSSAQKLCEYYLNLLRKCTIKYTRTH